MIISLCSLSLSSPPLLLPSPPPLLPASYTLTSSGDTLGRIIVPRLSYRLGDEVTVILDNSCSVHQVLQVIATLVYTEKIQDGCLQPNAPVKFLTTLVARETRGCTNSLITHFTLPIPTGHTQSFTTETG